MEDRGDRDDVPDTVLCHRSADAVEVQWAAEDLDPAPGLHDGHQLAVACDHMEEGHADQRGHLRPLAALGPEDAQAVLAAREEVRMREHRSLGGSRGPARIEDRREIVRTQVLDDDWLAVGKLGAGVDHRAAARVLHYVAHLFVRQARVDRNGHGAGQLRTKEREHPIDGVRHPDSDALAAADPFGAQPASDARAAVPKLSVGERSATGVRERTRASVLLDARA